MFGKKPSHLCKWTSAAHGHSHFHTRHLNHHGATRHRRDTSVSKDFDVSETFGGHFGNRLQRDVDRRRAAKVGTRQRLLLKLLTLWLWWLWWLWWLCYRCRMQENWAKLHFEFKPIGLDPRDHGVAQCLISLTARKCQFNCT